MRRLSDRFGKPKTRVGALLETAAGDSGKTSPLKFEQLFIRTEVGDIESENDS